MGRRGGKLHGEERVMNEDEATESTLRDLRAHLHRLSPRLPVAPSPSLPRVGLFED